MRKWPLLSRLWTSKTHWLIWSANAPCPVLRKLSKGPSLCYSNKDVEAAVQFLEAAAAVSNTDQGGVDFAQVRKIESIISGCDISPMELSEASPGLDLAETDVGAASDDSAGSDDSEPRSIERASADLDG